MQHALSNSWLDDCNVGLWQRCSMGAPPALHSSRDARTVAAASVHARYVRGRGAHLERLETTCTDYAALETVGEPPALFAETGEPAADAFFDTLNRYMALADPANAGIYSPVRLCDNRMHAICAALVPAAK